MENYSCSLKSLRSSDPLFLNVTKLQKINTSELLITYQSKNSSVQDVQGERQEQKAQFSCQIGRYGANPSEDGTITISDLSLDSNEAPMVLHNAKGHRLAKPFALDGDWLAVGAKKPQLGVFLYNLKDAKEGHLSECAYFPLSNGAFSGEWVWTMWPHLLEWPFFVHARFCESRAYVYCLWDLKQNEEKQFIPSYTIELPKGNEISSICRHSSSLFASTRDGKVWKLC